MPSSQRCTVIVTMTVGMLAGFFTDAWAASHPDEKAAEEKNTAEEEHGVETEKITEEELLFTEIPMVITASRKEESVAETPAAVYVINQEDIKRSGARTIPDLLRMAPGLDIAQIDANKWAVSSRGFNGRFAKKLLVLIDGRSVYTPLFSGVYWDVQDTLLEDIERIEVIRGPGAAMWGANAVNGVINIITKNAKDTQGGYVEAGGGTEERGFAGVRYGAALSKGAYLRVYGKYFDRDNSVDASGKGLADDWHVERGGFRFDWAPSHTDTLTLQGDAYSGEDGETKDVITLKEPYASIPDIRTDIGGGNVLTRWNRTFSETSNISLQLYYDRTERDDIFLGEKRDTFDLDFQNRFKIGDVQDFIWGAGYRLTQDDINNRFYFSYDPDNRSIPLYSVFLQDEITIIENRLRLTVGSKFEVNEFTGFEAQPNIRLLWTPHEKHTAWAAVSRAVKMPDRWTDDGRVNYGVYPGQPLALVSLVGNKDFVSEELLAYEAGYRVRPSKQLSLDVATFFNVYDNLETYEPTTVFYETTYSTGHYVFPYEVSNKMEGVTYGVELSADWKALHWLRLRPSYTLLEMQLKLKEGSTNTFSEDAEGRSPHNQFSLLSSADITRNVAFDLWLRYVEELPATNIESYVTVDARLAWKLRKNIELSLAGRNLVAGRHSEFKSEFNAVGPISQVERSVYAMMTVKF